MHNVILMVVIVVAHASIQITAQIVHALETFWLMTVGTLSIVEVIIKQAHVLNVLNGEMGHLGVMPMGIVNGRMENVLEISLLGSVFLIRLLEMGSVTIKPIMLAAATMVVIAVYLI